MKLIAVLLLGLASVSGVACAADITGVIELVNKKGTVAFDHQKHVNLVQDDCKVCHERPGEIKGFGRAYAHRVCIGCHEPQAGKMDGPITCEGCHKR
jgi:hypothetical protein